MLEREAIRWLQLTYKVPSEPSQKRVWVWRRLQTLGAFALQNSVYLLPFSEEVEKHFRQLAHEIREMGGEASLFSVIALDVDDERRILQVITEARESEYSTVIKVCARFLAKALAVVQTQGWNDQVHAEFAEVLETATKRAVAAESLMVSEQVFRMLLDQEYSRASRLLEMHSDLLVAPTEIDSPTTGKSLVGQIERKRQLSGGDESDASDLPI